MRKVGGFWEGKWHLQIKGPKVTASSVVKYCEATMADALAVVGHFLGISVPQQVLGKAFAEITAADFDAYPTTEIAAVDSQSVSSPVAAAPTSPNAASGLLSQADRSAAITTRDATVSLEDDVVARPAKRARTSGVPSVASPPAASNAELTCDCGLPAAHRRSQTQSNRDRPYACCRNSRPPGAHEPATSCKFFQWLDEAPTAAETRDITISCTITRVEDALITKAEHDGVLALLRAVDWSQVRNTNRQNVIPAGEDFCHSFTLGPNMFQQPPQPLSSSLRYPILERCLRSLVAACDPTFRFTNITANHNLACKPHRDTGNIGTSLIIGFGEYTGGQLAIDDTTGLHRVVDIKNRFVRFNGAKNKHWTLPFTGERYSAVFYTHRNAS